MKIFAFRFDIDHEYGLKKGVPNILDLAKKYDFKFSFYINMGKVFDLKEFIKMKKNTTSPDIRKISIRQKLGNFRLLKAMLINPNVGLSNINMLKRIKNEGHELGLHGGMNHMIWHRGLDNLSYDELEKDFLASYHPFKRLFGNPDGFVSPGFKWNKNVLDLLDKFKIKYCSDIYYKEPFYPEYIGKKYKHMQIPLNVIGSPFTIPIIEWLYANGKSEDEIVRIVKDEILKNNVAILYGHPIFEGFKTNILNEIFEFVKSEGYKVMTLNEIANHYKNRIKYHRLK